MSKSEAIHAEKSEAIHAEKSGNSIQRLIERKGESLIKLLKEKNDSYGNSFFESPEIIAKMLGITEDNPTISIGLDGLKTILYVLRNLDKLSRLLANPDYNDEDVAKDIAGYGLLFSVDKQLNNVNPGTLTSDIPTYASYVNEKAREAFAVVGIDNPVTTGSVQPEILKDCDTVSVVDYPSISTKRCDRASDSETFDNLFACKLLGQPLSKQLQQVKDDKYCELKPTPIRKPFKYYTNIKSEIVTPGGDFGDTVLLISLLNKWSDRIKQRAYDKVKRISVVKLWSFEFIGISYFTPNNTYCTENTCDGFTLDKFGFEVTYAKNDIGFYSVQLDIKDIMLCDKAWEKELQGMESVSNEDFISSFSCLVSSETKLPNDAIQKPDEIELEALLTLLITYTPFYEYRGAVRWYSINKLEPFVKFKDLSSLTFAGVTAMFCNNNMGGLVNAKFYRTDVIDSSVNRVVSVCFQENAICKDIILS